MRWNRLYFIIGTMLFLFLAQPSEAAWYSSAWLNRCEILLDNTAGETIARENEPVNVTIGIGSCGTNFDGQRANESIRVVRDADNATYPFYLISNTSTAANITFLANVSADTVESYYIYYNNPAATEQNYGIVRLLYDTFEEYADAAAMLSVWSVDDGNPTLGSGAVCVIGNQCMEMDGSEQNAERLWTPQTSMIWANVWIRVGDGNINSDYQNTVRIHQAGEPLQVYVLFGKITGADTIDYYTGSWIDSGIGIANGDKGRLKIWASAATDTYGFEWNDTLGVQSADFSAAPDELSEIKFEGWRTGTNKIWDDVSVWNANHTTYGDPLVVTLGAEESEAPLVKVVDYGIVITFIGNVFENILVRSPKGSTVYGVSITFITDGFKTIMVR